jgi:aldehyde dehydrogenase (NAD+)
MNPFQQLFDKQKTYFATDVTKSYAWRIDQLNRFKKLFIVRLKKFTEIDD